MNQQMDLDFISEDVHLFLNFDLFLGTVIMTYVILIVNNVNCCNMYCQHARSSKSERERGGEGREGGERERIILRSNNK